METMYRREAMGTTCHDDNGKGRDGSTADKQDPWNPAYPPRDPGPPCDTDITAHIKLVKRWMKDTQAIIANSRATNIIIPDRTPQWVNDAFLDTLPRLAPILEKDSVRCFLRLLDQNGRAMTWGFIITPETLNLIVVQNALRCAKLVLLGREPELDGFRANPNCMNQYGYFPLHRAAEIFSVDMIKLLLHHGASANLRTAGTLVIENLLPLHVAVENTCLHKYLEDNLFPNQEHLDHNQADINYILKLIHVLCLPEMKIFLDTTKLLAKHTDNLLDELLNYIKDGKLVHTAVLLLAAQSQIRGGTSRKRNVNNKPDRFSIITDRVLGNIVAVELEMCQNNPEQEKLGAKKRLFHTTLSLVHVISKAGEALDSYILSHPKVPHVMQVPHLEVLRRVSLILKDHGFCPTGEGIDIGNLCPYEDVLSNKELPDKLGGRIGTKAATEMPRLEMEQAKRKKEPRGWELKLARRSFFPFWRSALASCFPVKVTPIKRVCTPEQINRNNDFDISTQEGSTVIPVMGRIPQLTVNYQPRRLFGTAALRLLKVLKNA